MANIKDPKWRKRFIDLAVMFSEYSKDPSTRVGAVLVTKDCRIAGVGYNGPFRNFDDSEITNRDEKVLFTVHAEINAFAHNIIKNEDLYLIVTKPICSDCAKHAVLNNIKEIYCLITDDKTFNERWRNDDALKILNSMNINYYLINNKGIIQ